MFTARVQLKLCLCRACKHEASDAALLPDVSLVGVSTSVKELCATSYRRLSKCQMQ